MICIIRLPLYFLIAFSLIITDAFADPISGVIKLIGGEAAKKATHEKRQRVIEGLTDQVSKSNLVRLKEEMGNYVLEIVTKAAIDSERGDDEIAATVLKHKETVESLMAEDNVAAVEMALRNASAGWYLLKKYYNHFGPGSKWLEAGADNAIQEIWKLDDETAIDGSWRRLRSALSKGGLSGADTGICEIIFMNRLKAGRVPGFSKEAYYFYGDFAEEPRGIDIISIQNGQVRMIEFSAGSMPDPGNPKEMTDVWIIENWLEYISSPSRRIDLRSAGVPKELLNSMVIARRNFKVTEHFEKYLASPEVSIAKASRMNCSVVMLP